MGTRFVPVPDWETAAALLSEGLLWFLRRDNKYQLLHREIRSPEAVGRWYPELSRYCVQLED